MNKKYLLGLALSLLLTPAFGQFSIKKVVLEEFTGAWCQYCADGSYRAELMDNQYQDALMVAVHQGDAMTTPEGDSLMDDYSPAFPQATFNRDGTLYSRGGWSSQMSSLLQGATSVTVEFDSVGYNATTRQVTAVVRGTFTAAMTGDIRMNLIITEDEVTGTGSGYNQVNADNTTPGHPYQGAGNPIVGFRHRHVARKYVGGTWGLGGIIPNTVNFGSSYTHTFTYTLPAAWHADKIELVAYVGKVDGPTIADRPIINGEEFPLSSLVVGTPSMTADIPTIQVLGNPLVDRSKIVFTNQEAGTVTLEVIDLQGRRVALIGEAWADRGIYTNYWDGTNSAGTPVANGLYMVRMRSSNGQQMAARIQVAR